MQTVITRTYTNPAIGDLPIHPNPSRVASAQSATRATSPTRSRTPALFISARVSLRGKGPSAFDAREPSSRKNPNSRLPRLSVLTS